MPDYGFFNEWVIEEEHWIYTESQWLDNYILLKKSITNLLLAFDEVQQSMYGELYSEKNIVPIIQKQLAKNKIEIETKTIDFYIQKELINLALYSDAELLLYISSSIQEVVSSVQSEILPVLEDFISINAEVKSTEDLNIYIGVAESISAFNKLVSEFQLSVSSQAAINADLKSSSTLDFYISTFLQDFLVQASDEFVVNLSSTSNLKNITTTLNLLNEIWETKYQPFVYLKTEDGWKNVWFRVRKPNGSWE